MARLGITADQIYEVFRRHDPINLHRETPEYVAEAWALTHKIGDLKSVADLQRVLHDDFVTWLEPEKARVGAESRYAPVAKEIWALLGRNRSR